MEKQQTYTFGDAEIHVLSEALMMYSSYMDAMVLPNLAGDESDHDELVTEAALAKGMAVSFFNDDREFNWQQEKIVFNETHDRPMEHSDLSKFDFHEHAFGESEEDDNDKNTYEVDYYEDGERIVETYEGTSMALEGANQVNEGTHIIRDEGDVVWSHTAMSTNTTKKIE